MINLKRIKVLLDDENKDLQDKFLDITIQLAREILFYVKDENQHFLINVANNFCIPFEFKNGKMNIMTFVPSDYKGKTVSLFGLFNDACHEMKENGIISDFTQHMQPNGDVMFELI